MGGTPSELRKITFTEALSLRHILVRLYFCPHIFTIAAWSRESWKRPFDFSLPRLRMHQHIYYVLTDEHGHVFSGLQHTWTCDLPSSLEAQHVRETQMSTQSFFHKIRSHYPGDVNSEILEQGFHILAPKFTPKIVGIPLHFQFSGYQFLEEFEPRRGRPPPKLGPSTPVPPVPPPPACFWRILPPLFHTGGPPCIWAKSVLFGIFSCFPC